VFVPKTLMTAAFIKKHIQDTWWFW